MGARGVLGSLWVNLELFVKACLSLFFGNNLEQRAGDCGSSLERFPNACRNNPHPCLLSPTPPSRGRDGAQSQVLEHCDDEPHWASLPGNAPVAREGPEASVPEPLVASSGLGSMVIPLCCPTPQTVLITILQVPLILGHACPLSSLS